MNEPTHTVINHKSFSVYGRGSSLTKASLYLGSRGINAERVASYMEDVTYTAPVRMVRSTTDLGCPMFRVATS